MKLTNYAAGKSRITYASFAYDMLNQASCNQSRAAKFGILTNVMRTNCTRAKLSKKFFMQLPAGDLLVSTNLNDYCEPLYTGVIAGTSIADREKQWGDIVSAGANQRFCNVYSSQDEYDDFSETPAV